MIRIAICDDEKRDREEIYKLIQQHELKLRKNTI